MQDPDSIEIERRCKNLIGAEIKITSNIKLNDKSTWCYQLSNKNIVGDSFEEIMYPYLKKQFKEFIQGPKQMPPDFFNRGEFEYEMKCFTKKPSFDLGSFVSFVRQLTNDGGVERKLFKTKYLIFEYETTDTDSIVIKDFVFANLHELLNYAGKYPISIQVSDKTWKAIRPMSLKHRHRTIKTRSLFIEKFCQAIIECPNFIENREEKIQIIKTQFEQIVGGTKKRKRSRSDDDEDDDGSKIHKKKSRI